MKPPVDIGFRNAAVQRLYNERRRLVAEYGERGAKVIACRMQVLHAAPNLGLVPSDPPINLKATDAPELFTVDVAEGARLRLAVRDCHYDKRGVLLWRSAKQIDILGVAS